MINSISASELYKEIKSQHKSSDAYLSDSAFVIVKSAWASKKFWSEYKKWCTGNFVMKWQTFHDCDNKSILYMALMQVVHANAMQKRKSAGNDTTEGVAVGVMYYGIGGDTTKGHAINIIYSEGQLQYLEPQSGELVKLNQKEKDSCWYVTF
jgi:hypothetical protein